MEFISQSQETHTLKQLMGNVVDGAYEGCFLFMAPPLEVLQQDIELDLPPWLLGVDILSDDGEEDADAAGGEAHDLTLDAEGVLTVQNISREARSYFITVENCAHVMSAQEIDLLDDRKTGKRFPYVTFIVTLHSQTCADLATLVPIKSKSASKSKSKKKGRGARDLSTIKISSDVQAYVPTAPLSGDAVTEGPPFDLLGAFPLGPIAPLEETPGPASGTSGTSESCSTSGTSESCSTSESCTSESCSTSGSSSGSSGGGDNGGSGPAMSWLCTQASGGHLTHFAHPSTFHAVDFRCPPGTPVLALFPGLVLEVRVHGRDDVTGPHVSNLFCWNSILLQRVAEQGDGSEREGGEGGEELYAEYVHVQGGGILVREGEQVRRGQRLCVSGEAGFCPEPHLHLQLSRSRAPGAPSVPIHCGGRLVAAGNFYP